MSDLASRGTLPMRSAVSLANAIPPLGTAARHHGKARALGLGSFALVPLADARERALANRRVARSGGDPRRTPCRDPGMPSFEEAVGRVLAIHDCLLPI